MNYKTFETFIIVYTSGVTNMQNLKDINDSIDNLLNEYSNGVDFRSHITHEEYLDIKSNYGKYIKCWNKEIKALIKQWNPDMEKEILNEK